MTSRGLIDHDVTDRDVAEMEGCEVKLSVWPRTELTMAALAALADGERHRASDLAERVDTSPAYMAQLLGPLVRAGWVRSHPGPTGGHELAVDLDRLNVLDLVELVEGPTVDGRCVMADRACPSPDGCPMHDIWVQAREVLTEGLRGVTLTELLTPMRPDPTTTTTNNNTPEVP
ncbi:MAG: RrF2 family transcriptional regulator [Desertimonas sp.]